MSHHAIVFLCGLVGFACCCLVMLGCLSFGFQPYDIIDNKLEPICFFDDVVVVFWDNSTICLCLPHKFEV